MGYQEFLTYMTASSADCDCPRSMHQYRPAYNRFTREEGGFHHCQVANVTIGVHAMWDWIEDVLKPES